MASLQITIEIDGDPVAGHALNKVVSKFGQSEGEIVDRIGRANQATFPHFEYDPEVIVLQAVAAAVAVAEA